MCKFDKTDYGQYIFTAIDPWNNVEVESNRLQIEDERVRVHFLRHGYFNTYNPILDAVDLNERIFPLVFKDNKFEVDQNANPWITSDHDLPYLEGEGENSDYKVGQTTLRDGYFYIFDNDDIDYYYEFLVENGKFYPIFWGDENREKGKVKNVLDRREHHEPERIGWLLHSDRNMSVAFSSVQWSHAYHEKVLHNKKTSGDDKGLRDKRCFTFKSEHFAKNETSNNIKGRTQNIESLKVLHSGSLINNYGAFQYSSTIQTYNTQLYLNDLANQECQNRLMVDTLGKNDIFVTLFDPMGALFDLIDYFSDVVDYFICYVKAIQTGVDPREVYAYQKVTGNDLSVIDTTGWSPEAKGISEMFTLAAQIQKFLEIETPDQEKYKDAVNTQMLNKILDVEGRKKIRNILFDIKHAFKTMFDEISNYSEAESALIDYLDPDATQLAKTLGKNYVLRILSVLAVNISNIDGVYDTVELYKQECERQKKYDDFIKDFLSSKGSYTDNPFRKMLFEKVDFIKKSNITGEEKDYINLFNQQGIQFINSIANGNNVVEDVYNMLSSVLIEGSSMYSLNTYKEYDNDRLVFERKEIVPCVGINDLDMEYINATGTNDGTGVVNMGYEPDIKNKKQEAIKKTTFWLGNGKSGGDLFSDNQGSIDARTDRANKVETLNRKILDADTPEIRTQLQNKINELERPQKWYKDKYWFKFFKEGSSVQKVMDSKTIKGAGLGLAVFNMRNANLSHDPKNIVSLTAGTIGVAEATIQLGAKFSGKARWVAGSKFGKLLGPAAAVSGAATNIWEGVELASAGDTDASVAMFIAGAAAIGGAIPSPFAPLCWVIGIAATIYAENAKDDRMEKFLKNIPFSNRAELDYSEGEIWAANLEFYHTAFEYENDDYPFKGEMKMNNQTISCYHFLQAQLAFIYTQGRGFKTMEQIPIYGIPMPGGAKIMYGGKSPHRFNFNKYVKGYLSTGSLPISVFNHGVSIKAYFIKDGLIFEGGYKRLKIEQEGFNENDANQNQYNYKVDIKSIETSSLKDNDNDIVLQVKLIHSSGLTLPFKKDEYFCVKLRNHCTVMMSSWTRITDYDYDDLKWDEKHKTEIEAELKTNTQENLLGEHVF